MRLEKDIAKLCDEALSSGRAAFTYATYLRVNLAYKDDAAYRGWALVGVVMSGPMTRMLGSDETTTTNLRLLCDLIAKRLGSDLVFKKPKKTPAPDPSSPTWLVQSTGGPKSTTAITIDVDACERIARYARRDSRGEVTANGWRLRLRKPTPDEAREYVDRWVLEATLVNATQDREVISARQFDLGQLETTIGRMLRQPIVVRRPTTEH